MTTPDATTAAPVKSASLWEDFVDIFYAPASVFNRRRDGRWAMPLLLYTVLSAVLLYATWPMMRPMMEKQAAAQVEEMRARNMTPAQIETASKMSRTMIDSPYAIIPIVAMVPVMIFLTALLLWIASKIFGSVQSLGQSMTIATFANYPRLLTGIVSLAILYATGSDGAASQYTLGLSPAALMPDDTSVIVLAILSRFELGVLWVTALLGVGTYVIGRVSKQTAAIIAIVVWLIASIAVVGQAAMQAA